MKPLTFLVVDDEKAIRGILSRTVRMKGHVALEAATADEAIGIYEQQPVDAVFTDINTKSPKNGLDLVRAVHLANKAPIYVFATPHDGQETEVEAHIASGVIARYVAKPYTSAQVQECIDAVVAQYQARDQSK